MWPFKKQVVSEGLTSAERRLLEAAEKDIALVRGELIKHRGPLSNDKKTALLDALNGASDAIADVLD